jgi:hypothetical protein
MARVLWALLFLSACLEASITAAWKIPVEHFARDYQTNDEIRKLEKPPGDSDFLQPGDELWDLSKALRYKVAAPLPEHGDPFAEPEKIKLDQSWYGEWLVWNARSGMVVARGSWNDIFAAQKLIGFEDAPVTIRTRVELVTAGKETLSVSLVAVSDEESSAEDSGLKVDLAAKDLGPPGLVDGEFSVSWPAAEKDSRWEVNTGVTLEEGKRTRLARRGRGPTRCEVFASASREFSNGVKVSEARSIEGRDGVTVWPVAPDGDPRKDRLGNGLLVWSFGFSSDVSPIRNLGESSAKWPWMEAPAGHGEWLRGRVVDLRELLPRSGAELKGPDALAVFDPGSARITIAGTPEDVDVCEMAILHSVLSDPIYGRDLWIETNPEAGGWGLTCRSGENARIAKSSPAGNRPSFEIEPMIGESGRIVDLHYEFDVFSKGAPAGQVKSATSLELGKPQEIAGHSVGEGEEKVVLTVSEN